MTAGIGFPERFYNHNRKRILWVAPFFFVLGAAELLGLAEARSSHAIYGRVPHGQGWIRLESDPVGFWVTLAVYVAALVISLGILGLLGLGAIAARRRARSLDDLHRDVR